MNGAHGRLSKYKWINHCGFISNILAGTVLCGIRNNNCTTMLSPMWPELIDDIDIKALDGMSENANEIKLHKYQQLYVSGSFSPC